MYSSKTTDYQKYPPASPPTSAPYAFTEPVATGIPVNLQDNQSKGQVPWSTGLCDCFADVPNCCITCWCPCITFGQISEIVDKGSTSCGASGAIYALIDVLTACSCIYSYFYRSKLRQQYLLKKSPCGDCLVHCCCEPSALCQEYRELKNRGFDMSIGWHGNVERQTRGVAMAPVVQGGMTR